MLPLFKTLSKNEENNQAKLSPRDKLIGIILIVILILSLIIYIKCRRRQMSSESSTLSLDQSLNSNSDFYDQRATITMTEDLLKQRKEGEFYADDDTEESDIDSESVDFRIKMGENLTSSNTHSVNSNDNDEINSVKSVVDNFHTEKILKEDFFSAKERNLTPTKKRTSNMGAKDFKKTKTQHE